jgi:nicotinamidase-related amidase
VDDNRRLCAFIYRNLDVITRICPTLDTHQSMQIFHTVFLVNDRGDHPAPFTLVTPEEIEEGVWRFNPAVAAEIGTDADECQRHLEHYVRRLREGGKYELTVWPYHAMLGGIGHALVAAVEEAIFFHGMARRTQPEFEAKGRHPLTENYSVLRPEILEDAGGHPIAGENRAYSERLRGFDALIIAGQAKSHCVTWTMNDLLTDIAEAGERPDRIYLLEDATSPVVIPGVVDYTDRAEEAFRSFAAAGVHVVRTTDPLAGWPGISLD